MLIITEKPSVARQFADALEASAVMPFEYRTREGDYIITHCRGHLLELWDAERYDERMKTWNLDYLPVIPRVFGYGVIKETAKILSKVGELIRLAVRKNDEIMVATDAGREGEVIARLVLSYAKADGYGKASRFWVSESTAEKKTVLRGIEDRKLLKYYDKLAEEGLSWKKSDWIYGINLTVLFTLISRTAGWREKGVMNFGRVQTAVLYEIYKRQKEVENFREKPYLELEVVTDEGIRAYLVKPNYLSKEDGKFDENSTYIRNAEEEIRKSKNKTLFVENAEKKKESAEPPRIYNTSELLKDVYGTYKFSPAKTLALMQNLYEKRGTLSYPRTPSRVLGEGDEGKALEWLDEQLKKETEIGKYINRGKYTLKNKRLFDNEKLEDHHGLVPLKYMEKEDTDEYKVWKLVQLRYLMQGMACYETETLKITFKLSDFVFIGRIKVEITGGWKDFESGGEKEEIVKLVTPLIRKGMLKKIKGYNLKKLKTKPPKLHNYSSIISFMQNPKNEEGGGKLLGIGTEATRAAHIKGLEDHGMITGKRGFTATEKGKRLLSLVDRCDIMRNNVRAAETTEWEEIGKKNGGELLERTKTVVEKAVSFYRNEAEKIKDEGGGREIAGSCPLCGKRIYEGNKVYFCEDFKDGKKCGFTLWKGIGGVDITLVEARDLFAGKTVNKEGKKSISYILKLNKNGELETETRIRTRERKVV